MSMTQHHLESIDPFDPGSASLFVRAEHLARYLYAAQFLRKRRLRRALDVGCAGGYGCRALAQHAERVAGVDRAAICGGSLPENVTIHQAELLGGLSAFPDGAFDLAACFEVLEHVPDDAALLKGLHRVLRRGGWLLLSVPKAGYEPCDAGGRPLNPYHYRLYTTESLRELLQAHGFVVESLLGQPYSNTSRANTESWRRDSGSSAEEISGFFVESPRMLDFAAHVWGWPTDEAPEKSNVIFAVCRRA